MQSFTKISSAELHKKHSRKMVGDKPQIILASKIFEVKRKGVRYDVLTSNILFDDIWVTMVSLT